ncbi:MAG: hypothetical protein BKP49_00590 [Treponema sp. CETP13]|nr:MAG: hypothetical protein BKP49_00590 [Treponema sp. CETP13]
MSDFLYTDYTDFYSQQLVDGESTEKKVTNKRMKIVRVLITLLVLVIFVEVGIYVFVIPCSKPANVIFTGVNSSVAKMFQDEIQQKCGSSWLKFNVGVASSILVSNPAVLSATVEKSFPDKVYISIEERIPVAVTLTEKNGRTIPVQIDKKGVLFETNTVNIDKTVPLITGLPSEISEKGKRLSGLYLSLLEEIEKIQNNNPEYFLALSEIHIRPKEYGDFELELYPINSKVRVRMDRNLTSESLQYMMVLLDVLNTINPDINEIDLRYGAVSYTTKSRSVTGGSRVE